VDAMNDLEELVREELRARVAAAEAQHPAESAVALLRGLEQRIRVTRLRRRWTGAALSAVAVAAAIALPLTLLAPGPPLIPDGGGRQGPVPLSDPSLTPPGWVPVAYGDAQVSVPADWHVSTRPVCGRVGLGYVVLGTASTSLVVRNPRCRQAANRAAILQEPGIAGHPGRSASVINGIRVWRVAPVPVSGYVSYAVPALHVLVTARGPLARRLLGTLTRSPLSVVLEPGQEAAVPDGWLWRDFGGIRFAAPAGWRQEHLVVGPGCPVAVPRAGVTLVKTTTAIPISCSSGPTTAASALTAQPGVVVATGPFTQGQVPSGSHCGRLHELRACYSRPIYIGGMLDLYVYVPGWRRPTVVEIGLAGNGVVARTIFDSIRPG